MLSKDEKTLSVHSRDIEATDHENSSAVDHEPESTVGRTTVARQGGRRSEDSLPDASDRRPSSAGTVDSLEDASDTQILKRLLRTIQHSEWSENTVVGLLKQMVDSKNTRTDTTLPQTTHLDHGPRSRVLIPGPRLVDWSSEGERRREESDLRALAACAPWDFREPDPELEAEQEPSHRQEFLPVELPFSSSLAYLKALTWRLKNVLCISSALVGSSGIFGGEQSAFEGFALSSA